MTNTQSDNTATGPSGDIQCSYADTAAEKLLARHIDIFVNPENSNTCCDKVKYNPSRTVWRCQLDGREYYLKQFHSEKFFKRLRDNILPSDAKWELKISRHLLASGVNAQRVLMAGKRGKLSWIVTEAIPNAAMLCDFQHKISAAPAAERKKLKRRWISALARLLAGMHNCGVLHLDLHSGNIMLDAELARAGKAEPIICDLHRIRLVKRPRRLAAARDIARIDHDCGRFLTAADRLRFLKKYLQHRTGAKGTLRGWALICLHLKYLHNRKFLNARDKRIRTANSYFLRKNFKNSGLTAAVLKTKTPCELLPETLMNFPKECWAEIFSNTAALLDKTNADVFKDSPSALVIRKQLNLGENKVMAFIKLARNKKKHKFLLDAIRKSRSRRAFERSHELLQRDIPTAFALAFCEKRACRFLKFNILVTAEFTNSQSASDFISDHCNTAGLQTKRDALKTVAKLIREMHDSGYTHRDLKAPNVLVRKSESGKAEAALIDMDGLSKPFTLGLDKRLANIARLLASLQNCRGFSQQDQDFFVAQYLGPDAANIISVKLCNELMTKTISHKRKSPDKKP